MRYSRFRAAVRDKESLLRELFSRKNLHYPPGKIFICVLKLERTVELWANKSNENMFELVKSYRICYFSGEPGPKRQQGDLQIPEGFYVINGFNPVSKFHLSLRINYPNQSDSILGVRGRLGGDIFVHGACISIGCIPITDDGIKELYVIAVGAKTAGQRRIPVHIFPARLDREGIERLRKDFPVNIGNFNLWNFWLNLKDGFDFFEKHRRLPAIMVDSHGKYIIRSH